MELSQEQMLQAALYAVIVGYALGAVYDLVRIRRLGCGSGIPDRLEAVLVFAGDIIYALICSVVVTVLLYHTNYGRIRWFMLAGAGAGFVLYRFTLGVPVKFCIRRLFLLLSFIFSLTGRFVLRPVGHFFAVIIKFTNFAIAYAAKRIYNIYYKGKMRRRTRRAVDAFLAGARAGFEK